MFSHIMLGSNDIERSRVFYDAVMAALGGKPAQTDPLGRLFYRHDGGTLIITPPIDGEPATHANGGTIGFTVTTTEQADAWHAAGVANGGTSIEEPPGYRERIGIRYYGAYLRDPDGNKLAAVILPH